MTQATRHGGGNPSRNFSHPAVQIELQMPTDESENGPTLLLQAQEECLAPSDISISLPELANRSTVTSVMS